ncbi:PAS domain S-box protein, partial [Thermodesulfobacteriota bacterium]
MTELHILDGIMAGHSFDMRSNTILIGRSADNDVQIKDTAVSRKHLKIIRQEDKFFVEDLGSQNGTWVKGQLIRPREAVEVEPGNSIVAGNILLKLGEEPLDDYHADQYSISLSDLAGEGGESLLHKSTITTNRKRLEQIHEVSTALSQSLEVDEICEKIMDSLFYCLKKMDSGIVLLVDSNTGILEKRISRSREGNEDIKVSYSQTIVDRVMREGKAMMMADTRQEDAEDLSDSIEMMKLRSIMCTPLISKSGIKGVIYVHSTRAMTGFPRDDLFLLAGLSSPVAVALEKASLYSERKQAEETLGGSVRQWHTTFDAISDAVCILDPEGRILRCNKTMSKLLGKPFKELLGRNCCEMVHGTSKPVENCPVLLMRNTRTRETLEYQIGEQWFEAIADPVFDKHGKIIETVHIFTDITPRKLAESALRESEKRFRSIIENTDAGYFFIDKDGFFKDVNDAWLRMHRYSSRDEVIGQHFSLTQIDPDQKVADENVKKMLEGEQLSSVEFSRQCKDGSIGYHTATVSPVTGGGEMIGIEGFIIDSTDKKRLEVQLLQSHKMQAIGTLAGGIAHEFNNVLGIILGNAELAMLDIPISNPASNFLVNILTASKRARDAVKQILTISRQKDQKLRPVDITALVKESIKLLRAIIPKNIEIRQNISCDLNMVNADQTQLSQVLINLCTNAADAMKERGGV